MSYRWIVKLHFRCDNDRQRSVIDNLGPLAHDVVRLWLRVILPDARLVEQQDRTIRHVAFPSRAAARRFVATWGGKLADNR
jgi:hypothetical protein